MAQPQFNPIGMVEGQVANNVIGNAIGLPFMPSFYNSRYTNPAQGFANSEAAGLARGNTAAWRHYGGRTGGRVLGGILGGPVGAIVGGYLGPHLADLATGYGWNGQGDGQGALFGSRGPTGTVTVGGINGSGGSTSSDGYTMVIDPTTGQTQLVPTTTGAGKPTAQSMGSFGHEGGGNYMPAFNGGNSWGFATSTNPYAMLYGGSGGVPQGLNNLGAANQDEVNLLGVSPRYVAK